MEEEEEGALVDTGAVLVVGSARSDLVVWDRDSEAVSVDLVVIAVWEVMGEELVVLGVAGVVWEAEVDGAVWEAEVDGAGDTGV